MVSCVGDNVAYLDEAMGGAVGLDGGNDDAIGAIGATFLDEGEA